MTTHEVESLTPRAARVLDYLLAIGMGVQLGMPAAIYGPLLAALRTLTKDPTVIFEVAAFHDAIQARHLFFLDTTEDGEADAVADAVRAELDL